MKPVSEDLRMRIVSVYEEGRSSFPQVAERFRVSVSSVKRFVGKFRETGSLTPEPAANGSHRVLDESDIQYLKGVLNSKTDVTQEELRDMLRTATGAEVSQPTVCRTLRREGITRKKKQNGRKSRRGKMSESPAGSSLRR